MGLRSGERGNAVAVFAVSDVQLLQWGRAQVNAETPEFIASPHLIRKLQWGRAQVAQKRVGANPSTLYGFASMGPRQVSAETKGVELHRQYRDRASMGPRSG